MAVDGYISCNWAKWLLNKSVLLPGPTPLLLSMPRMIESIKIAAAKNFLLCKTADGLKLSGGVNWEVKVTVNNLLYPFCI